MEDSPETLTEHEIARGKLIPRGANGHCRKSFDIAQPFRDILGLTVGQAPANYEHGESLSDTALDLESNISLGLARENSLFMRPGKLSRNAVVEMARTFRTGTNDVDAVDFVDMFLEDHSELDAEALKCKYVLINFCPCVTNLNWRMDCGVAGYDNSTGLPPFFPTRLRFEDYIYRLWIQQGGFAAAHIASAQTDTKNNYMRNPLASEVFSEAICGLLKRKIRTSLRKTDELGITFDYEGAVSLQDSEEILDGARSLHARASAAGALARTSGRREAIGLFAAVLSRTFYDFVPDFFQQNVSPIVDDEVGLIRSALEIWPNLLKIIYSKRHCRALPMRRIRSKEFLASGRITQQTPA